jgi:hypothetical protein
VLSKIAEPVEQARALIDLTYGRGSEFKVEIHDGVVSIMVPDRSKFDFAWAAAKPRVIDQIRTHLKPQSIRLVEEFLTPAPKDAAKDNEKGKEPAAKDEGAAAAPKHEAHAHEGHSHDAHDAHEGHAHAEHSGKEKPTAHEHETHAGHSAKGGSKPKDE